MKTKLTILIIILIGLTSCEKYFDYNFDVKPVVVVNCLLKANDTIFVDLSYTKKEMMNFEKIENAEIFIYEENIFKEKLLHIKEGKYKSINFIPQEEKKYTLKVKIPEHDTITANTFIPKLVELDTLTHFFVQASNQIEEKDREHTQMRIIDKLEQKDFYLYKIDYVDGFPYSDDPVFKDVLRTSYSTWYNKGYFSDDLFNGKIYNISVDYPYLDRISKDSLWLNFEFGSISEEMFLYLNSVDEQDYSMRSDANYFMEPVPIYSNITNGIGIFAGYATKEYEYVFVKP